MALTSTGTRTSISKATAVAVQCVRRDPPPSLVASLSYTGAATTRGGGATQSAGGAGGVRSLAGTASGGGGGGSSWVTGTASFPVTNGSVTTSTRRWHGFVTIEYLGP